MATHETISEFTRDSDDWTDYTKRLQKYFLANDVDDAAKGLWTCHIQDNS